MGRGAKGSTVMSHLPFFSLGVSGSMSCERADSGRDTVLGEEFSPGCPVYGLFDERFLSQYGRDPKSRPCGPSPGLQNRFAGADTHGLSGRPAIRATGPPTPSAPEQAPDRRRPPAPLPPHPAPAVIRDERPTPAPLLPASLLSPRRGAHARRRPTEVTVPWHSAPGNGRPRRRPISSPAAPVPTPTSTCPRPPCPGCGPGRTLGRAPLGSPPLGLGAPVRRGSSVMQWRGPRDLPVGFGRQQPHLRSQCQGR